MKKSMLPHLNSKPPGNPPALGPRLEYWSWAAGGSGWQFARKNSSAAALLAALHHALELGVNWIDTAAVYGVGSSKEIVSLALAGADAPRPKVVIPPKLRPAAPVRTCRTVMTVDIQRPKLNLTMGERATERAGRAQ